MTASKPAILARHPWILFLILSACVSHKPVYNNAGAYQFKKGAKLEVTFVDLKKTTGRVRGYPNGNLLLGKDTLPVSSIFMIKKKGKTLYIKGLPATGFIKTGYRYNIHLINGGHLTGYVNQYDTLHITLSNQKVLITDVKSIEKIDTSNFAKVGITILAIPFLLLIYLAYWH